MTSLTLRYGEDPATGLPRLDDAGVALPAATLEVLRRAIDRQFERLVRGPDGQVLALDGEGGPDLPGQFRVTVAERDRRCPTLLLEAVEAPPAVESRAAPQEAAAPEPQPGRWQAQFLAEVAELVADAPRDDGLHSPLDFVLADLRAVLRKDPRKFAWLLFAGYLHVGDALSLKYGEGGDNAYARAARILTRCAGAALPEGALGKGSQPPRSYPERL